MIICPARILLNTFHSFRSAGEQFLLFPGISALGHFVPRLRPGASAPGRRQPGLGRLPNKHFGKQFCRPTAQKFRVCSHSNCLPKTQVWLHLPCLPLVKRPQKAFLPQCENKYHATPLTDYSCSYILYLKPAPQEGQ